MSGNANGGGIGPLAFIVGGLVVAVGIGVFLFSGGYIGGPATSTSTERTTVSTPASPAQPAATTTTTTTERK
jgi:hypothetical protein